MRKIDSLAGLDEFNNEIRSLTEQIRTRPEAGWFEYIFKKRQLWEDLVISNNNIMQRLPGEIECSAEVFLVYMHFHVSARGRELKNSEELKRSGLATLGQAAAGLYSGNIVTLVGAATSYLRFTGAVLKSIKSDVWRGEKGFYDSMFGAYKIDRVREPIVLERASWELDTYEIPTSRMPAVEAFVKTDGGPSWGVLSQFIAT